MIEEPYVLAKTPSGKYDAVPMSQAEAMKQMIYADEIHIKYLYRYPKKGTLETDLAKAAQYMEFLKEYFEKKGQSHDER